MMLPWSSFHAHVRRRNSSRPTPWRVLPSFASSRSTITCVEIPAWSVPGTHSAASPRMRCQRTSVSSIVAVSAWPMCSRPVTFGGGSTTVNAGCPASAAGLK
jgi:hypothetical protein